MRRRAAAAGLALAAGLAAVVAPVLAFPAAAQEAAFPAQGGGRFTLGEPARAMILAVDQEALFAGSAFGRRLRAQIEEASRELAAENRRIEAQLTAEERGLTDRRAVLGAEAFRSAAAAFDEKVTRIRSEQDAKSRDLARLADQERKRFLEAALPVLGDLLRETGAVAILDSRAILLSAEAINVTGRAVARLDALLGDGGGDLPAPPQAGGGAAPEGGGGLPAAQGGAAPVTPPPPGAGAP